MTTLYVCPATKIGQFVIPGTVTDIRDAAFYGCVGLTSVIIPDGISIIGEDAFGHCTGLTEIVLPRSVRSIGSLAFLSCTRLALFYSANPVPPATDEHCFNGLPEDATLYVPEGSVETYRRADEWSNFKNIKEFDATGINGVEVDKNGKNVCYDLSGRRLSAPVKGLNIVGGKKVMVK